MNKKNTIESIAITTLKKNKVFYSHKMDKDLTAIASYYKIKIRTERLIVVNPQTCKCDKITKITIL
jgi:hypothetical protein